jgi:hypothetical protein
MKSYKARAHLRAKCAASADWRSSLALESLHLGCHGCTRVDTTEATAKQRDDSKGVLVAHNNEVAANTFIWHPASMPR